MKGFGRTATLSSIHGSGFALKSGVSLIAIGLSCVSAPAFAQDSETAAQTQAAQAAAQDQAQTPSETADDIQDAASLEGDVIIVSGFRESLQSAQAIKRNSDVVVDSITAEDIGALPDRSVTEALQRVAGVTINRFAAGNDPDHFAVEGSGVVVRGLSYVGSRFNGRDAFTSGNGQGLNFADVPSELLGGVDVFKTPSADMIEGGIGGIVNLRTRKPLDQNDDYFGATAEINLGDFAERGAPTVSVLGSKIFDTGIGEIGILGSFSYSQLFSRADRLAISSFRPRTTYSDGTRTDVLPFDGADAGQSILFPRGATIGSQEFDRERYGYSGALQWRSNDGTLEATAQFIRSDARQTWGERVVEIATDNVASNGDSRAVAGTSIEFDDDGLFESGFITSPTGWRDDQNGGEARTPAFGLQSNNIRRDHFEQYETNDYSFNLQWTPSDVFALSFDYQHVDSDSQVIDNTLWTSTYQDAFIDLSGGGLPTVAFQPPQNCEDPACPGVPGSAENPLFFRDGNMSFVDPYNTFWRSAMDHLEVSDGSSDAFRLDAELSFPDSGFLSSIKAGARYQDEQQTARFSIYNWGVLSEQWGNGGPVWMTDNVDGVQGGTGGSPTADQAYPFFYDDFFRGDADPFQGSGRLFYNTNTIANQADYVAFAEMIAREWAGTATCDDGREITGGFNALANRCGNVEGTPFQPGEINPQQSKNYAAYGLATIETDFANGWNLSGNIGLRYTRYERKSRGFQQFSGDSSGIPTEANCAQFAPGGAQEDQTPPPFCTFDAGTRQAARDFLDGSTIQRDVDLNYDYWLPSVNMRLRVTPDLQFRAGYFKGIFDPDFGFTRNFFTVTGIDPVPVVDPNTGNAVDGQFIPRAVTGSAIGNPNLLPIVADNFDLTAEWYFDDVGSLTVSAFHKRLKNVVTSDSEVRSITNNGATFDTLVTTPVNSDQTGKITGFEIAYQQTYDFLPGFLSGLGLQATYTYVDSSGVPQTVLNPTEPSVSAGDQPQISGDEFELSGLSTHTVNITPFIDIGPLSARASYNYRSSYLLTLRDVITPFDPIFQKGYGQLDASVTATITDNFKIGLQGVNLLNSITETQSAVLDADGNIRKVPRQYYTSDRRFTLVTRFTF